MNEVSSSEPESIVESAKAIPVVAEVDVVVVGGTTWGVAAAVAARRAGASVYLIASRSYLGEDLCATLRMTMAPGQSPPTPLAATLFPDGDTTTPLRVTKVPDKTWLDADVSFIFGCLVSDLLTDDSDLIRPGEENFLTIHSEDIYGVGGLWHPSAVYTRPGRSD